MKIRFCLDDGGEQLYEMVTEDVVGIITAANGDKVVFQDRYYKYDNHILNHYVESGKWIQEVVIYMVDYVS
jgi:hypothetical protein